MPTKTPQSEMQKVPTVAEAIAGKPKLRFGGFSGAWEEKKLGEVLQMIDGDRGVNYPSTRDFTEDGFCLFLNAKNVTKRGFLFEEKSFITKEKDEQLRKGKLKRNDIVLTTRGSIGHISYYNHEVPFDNIRINSGMVLLRGKQEVTDSNFIYRFLDSKKIQNKIRRISFGSAQPQLTVKEIHNLKISFPTLPEQQKIAEFLGGVDEWIENLREQKESLVSYKKGMMQKIFSQEIRFKDDKGNEFPGWEEKKLGEVLKIGSGRDYKHLNPGNIPVFGTGGYMLSVDKALYSGETVCIGRKGTIDKPFYYNGDLWTVDTLFYTHSFKGITPKYTNMVFQKINWKKYNEASGVPSLSKTTIEKIKVLLPSLPEQQKIAEFLGSIDKVLESKQQQITQAEQWKKGLMQGLFV